MKSYKKIEVVCYDGYRANEKPLSFVLEGHRREVREILKQWREQDHDCFKIVTDNHLIYLLKWDRCQDQWSLFQLSEV